MAELTDEEIVSRVKQGQTFWFALLVERYKEKLSRYARRFLFTELDTDDLVQEVFVKAFTNIHSFDSKQRFSPWIYRIAHNEFVNSLRKRKFEAIPFFDPDTILPHPMVEEESEDDIILKEKLGESLGKIDPKYREPLVLHYYEEMDYKEISEVLHIPPSTVGVRLSRGRALLRKLVDNTEQHGN